MASERKIRCRGCGVEVYIEEACPNCGTRTSPKLSSFIIGIIVIGLGLLVGLVFLMPSSESVPSAQASTSQSDLKPTVPEPVEMSEPQKSAWAFEGEKDGKSGEVNGRAYTQSVNSLEGWLEEGEVVLGYDCSTGFYVKATGLGFSTDKVVCGNFTCRNAQISQVGFDSTKPRKINFSIWEDNHDGMYHWESAKGGISKSELVQKMKTSSIMSLELELFNTAGRQQVAEFDLTGFTDAITECL